MRLNLQSEGLRLSVDPEQGGQFRKWSDKPSGLELLGGHAGLMEHALQTKTPLAKFVQGQGRELGDFLRGTYQSRRIKSGDSNGVVLTRSGSLKSSGAKQPVQLTKTVTLPVPSQTATRSRTVLVTHQWTNRSGKTLSFLFGSEFTLNLKDAHVNRVGEAHRLKRFAVVDAGKRLRCSFALSKPASLWYFPIETEVRSGKGKTMRAYQGVSLSFLWSLALRPKAVWSVKWELNCESPQENF